MTTNNSNYNTRHFIPVFVFTASLLSSPALGFSPIVPVRSSLRRRSAPRSTAFSKIPQQQQQHSIITSQLWAATQPDVGRVQTVERQPNPPADEQETPFFAVTADLDEQVHQQALEIESSFDTALSSSSPSPSSALSTIPQSTADENNTLAEYIGLGSWITALSSFLLVNNYVGPWPANLLASIPVKAFGLTHAVTGMLFGGGIILTTLLEWLAVGSKDTNVLKFYFDKVPKLDAFVVLPALTGSILSGVGLAVDHYGSLGDSPFHVVGAISTLLAFAIWWAVTDVTTQGKAMTAINEWIDTKNTALTTTTTTDNHNDHDKDVPQIVQMRKISNVISCLFVVAIYGFMVLKPGYTPPPPVMM